MDHIDRLVHPDARASEFEQARQRTFIATRLGLFLAAIVALPIYLACGHVPALWEALALAFLTVPLGAAAYVSRTGRLAPAESACLATWIGVAAAANLGGGLSLCGTWALLLLVPLEATFSSDPRQVTHSAFAALTGALALAAVQLLGVFAAPVSAQVAKDAAIVGPVLIYAVVLAVSAAGLQRLRQRLHAQGEQRYRVLSEAIGDLVLRYDRAGGVLMASREAEQLFGIKPRDLLGRGFFERVHVADRPAFLKAFSDAAATGENVSATLRLRVSRQETAPGEFEEPQFAWIELRARRFDTSRSSIVAASASASDPAIVAIVRDITAQRHHEHAIQQARDEAERASAWKDGFLANVSHELRTPLNAIIGFSEMLSNAELSPADPVKQREYARIITTSGQHLLAVVNSLLDISKIEAGRFDLDPEPFAVGPMIQSCCDMVGLKAEQAGIAISRDIAGTLDEMVGDKRACKQIVINLLSNALKFTGRGGQVSIAARLQGPSVLITVTDTGVGISPLDLAHLGNAFFQARSGLDRAYEGTGLGLSVVGGLVGLHGGSIALESAPGEGTCVTVRLPLDCRDACPGATTAKIETTARYMRSGSSAGRFDNAKVQKIA
jgi:cell cycle sensor histidine kinase DivJ